MSKPNKIDVLGVRFDNLTFEEALSKALSFLDGGEPKTLFTPNPEFVMESRGNKAFRDILNNGDLVVPDGIGIVLASKLGRHKIQERVAGYDLVQALFNRIKNSGHTVYLYGAKPGVAELAKIKMEEKHPGLKIIGTKDGYQDESGQEDMIKEIQTLRPDILLVCIGFPKEELWIEKNKKRLPCKLLIGAGGSIDGMSGQVKRAPEFFRKHGLEWFYRLVKQPSRFKRQLKLPLFMLIAIWARLFGK